MRQQEKCKIGKEEGQAENIGVIDKLQVQTAVENEKARRRVRAGTAR